MRHLKKKFTQHEQTSHPFKTNKFHKQSRFDTALPQSLSGAVYVPLLWAVWAPTHQNAHVQSYPSAHFFDCGWPSCHELSALVGMWASATDTPGLWAGMYLYPPPPPAPGLGVSPNISPSVSKNRVVSQVSHIQPCQYCDSLTPWHPTWKVWEISLPITHRQECALHLNDDGVARVRACATPFQVFTYGEAIKNHPLQL